MKQLAVRCAGSGSSSGSALRPAVQVAAVDLSVHPPSYGVDIGGNYRETEAGRLSPLPAQQPEDDGEPVEGLGHSDAATEAKEAAVRALEQ
jgi:hypothetical protein